MKTTILILLTAAAAGGFGFGLAQTPTPKASVTQAMDIPKGSDLHIYKSPAITWLVWLDEDNQLRTFKLPKGTTIETK